MFKSVLIKALVQKDYDSPEGKFWITSQFHAYRKKY